jgi:branched-chain amino acid transport system ATP-binding protein
VLSPFSGFTAVKNVDISVRRNTIHSVIGPNGAGKSTLFNLLTRFLEADAGSITYKGADVTRTTPAQLARQGVVRSFQISAVFPHLTASQNLCIPLQRMAGFTKVFWRPERDRGPRDRPARALRPECVCACGGR